MTRCYQGWLCDVVVDEEAEVAFFSVVYFGLGEGGSVVVCGHFGLYFDYGGACCLRVEEDCAAG